MRCYNCRAEQPTVEAVCAKGSCINTLSLDEAIFCFAHQQSLVEQVNRLNTKLDESEEK
jgi:hypothetical protein